MAGQPAAPHIWRTGAGGYLMSPWPYDRRCQQGPSPHTPIFRRELFPHGAPPIPKGEASEPAANDDAPNAGDALRSLGDVAAGIVNRIARQTNRLLPFPDLERAP
jgi:hypothetical protein